MREIFHSYANFCHPIGITEWKHKILSDNQELEEWLVVYLYLHISGEQEHPDPVECSTVIF